MGFKSVKKIAGCTTSTACGPWSLFLSVVNQHTGREVMCPLGGSPLTTSFFFHCVHTNCYVRAPKSKCVLSFQAGKSQMDLFLLYFHHYNFKTPELMRQEDCAKKNRLIVMSNNNSCGQKFLPHICFTVAAIKGEPQWSTNLNH